MANDGEWTPSGRKSLQSKTSDSSGEFSDLFDHAKFETGSGSSSHGAGSVSFSQTHSQRGSSYGGREERSSMKKSMRSSMSGAGMLLLGHQSRLSSANRSGVKLTNLGLAPLEETAAATNGKKRLSSRRISPFSQDPRKRSSSVKEEPREEEGSSFFQPLQLIKDVREQESQKRRQYLLLKQQQANPVETTPRMRRRQVVVMPKVTVPKRNLMKLTGLPYEFDRPGYYDDRVPPPDPRKYWDHTKFSYVLGSHKRSYNIHDMRMD